MRCHYIYIKNKKNSKPLKVLIPSCIGVGVYNDMAYCTCRKEQQTFKEFERELFNIEVKKNRQEIKELEKENAILWRMIKKLGGIKITKKGYEL